MLGLNMHGKSGDALRCKVCGNERIISQTWLDGLMRRYYPTSARRSTTLDLQTIARLKCSECNGKSWQLVAVTLGRNIRPTDSKLDPLSSNVGPLVCMHNNLTIRTQYRT